MAHLATNVAVPKESATLILLRLARTTLDLKTRTFLAVLLRFFPASTLALALARLVPSFLLGATWLVQAAVDTARLPVISPHECGVVPLSN